MKALRALRDLKPLSSSSSVTHRKTHLASTCCLFRFYSAEPQEEDSPNTVEENDNSSVFDSINYILPTLDSNSSSSSSTNELTWDEGYRAKADRVIFGKDTQKSISRFVDEDEEKRKDTHLVDEHRSTSLSVSTLISFLRDVGLLGLTPSLQKDLHGIRNWSKEFPDLFNSAVDRWSILPAITLSLVRHLDYCISVYSSVDVKRSIKDGVEHLKELCIEERGKLDEETPVNVNNTEKQSATSKRANEFSNEYHVITILLVVKGVHELAAINGSENLKEALQKLGSISSIDNLAVEVLWNEKGIPTERELLEDYPLLRPL